VAIHAVSLSGGTPAITQPSTMDCTLSCSYPCAKCDVARFAVDKYAVTVPGPWAVAIHVIDGLAAAEAQAEVGSINDDNFDPAPKQNGAVLGAAIYRTTKQSYVVAASAMDGVSPATMSLRVPGGSPSRHIVFDAPEAADGTSSVTATVQSGRCVLTITAGSSGGFAGHPLMFAVGDAASGCTASDTTNVAPGAPPPGGEASPAGPTGSGTPAAAPPAPAEAAPPAARAAVVAAARWRKRRRFRRRCCC